MPEITSNYTNPDYSTSYTDNVSQSQARGVGKYKEEKEGEEAITSADKGDLDLSSEELIAKNPKLKATFDNLSAIATDPSMGDKDVFSMQSLIACLINLGQVLQQVATVYANHLSKVTEKMNAYAKLMGQIPVVLEKDVDFDKESTISGTDEEKDRKRSQLRADLNQYYGNMLEAVRGNKGVEEDKAKRAQTIMQTMKDASQSTHDFIGTFIDLIRGIGQKTMR